MKHLSIIAIITLALCVMSCGSATSDDITVAEVAVAEADYDTAKKICDDIFAAHNDSTLSVNDLCRISIVYMKLSDIADEDENTALATQCYRLAIGTSPDSARAFYHSLPIDEAQHVEVMATLEQWIDGNRDIIADPDSVYTIPADTLMN